MKIDYPMVRILRMNEDPISGTFGALLIQEKPFCATLEPGDLLNEEFRSSIPAQQYWCKKHYSPKFHDTYLVLDVPGRTDVLFHSGNTNDDTLGCIVLAQYWGKLHGDRAVLNSGSTFWEFLKIMEPYKVFHLTIKECY